MQAQGQDDDPRLRRVAEEEDLPPMQFDHNIDFPPSDVTAPPLNFPPARIDPCARITTRVYHPTRNATATVQHVLVRTMLPRRRRASAAEEVGSSDSDSSDSDSSDSDSDEEMMDEAEENVQADCGGGGGEEEPEEERAYWMQRTLRECIYGKVRLAVVLRRRQLTIQRAPVQSAFGDQQAPQEAEWEVTRQYCAVKEMSWQHIRRQRGRLAEDPIAEVSAMQFISRGGVAGQGDRSPPERFMVDNHVLIPMDLLSDDRHLYCILPYCNGGELFDRLESHEKFTEQEARYWMRQILTGLEHLQTTGICHRDISLENLLVHNKSCLIIDFGMSLRIPFLDPTTNRTDAPPHTGQRLLIAPQGTCGKWHYMSPEIMSSQEPFDGYAVDMWATGVILFLMLTGFPPWERPCRADDRFRYMTAGYMVQMLTEWQMDLTHEAMDLLQKMLWFDPRDRLSLAQVRAHPWILNEDVTPPNDIEEENQPWV